MMLLLSLATLLGILVQYVDGNQRIVHVNENYTSGEDVACCVYGKCSCNSLDRALANITSNVLINIATDVTLSSIINVSDIEDVTIVGHNNPTVYCANASIQLTACHNCIVQGITWDGCGTADEIINFTEPALNLSNSSTEIINYSKPALDLCYASNVTIQNCSFWHSVGQAIVLSEVSDVKINDCKFVNNSYRGHGAAIHYSSNSSQFAKIIINNCKFSSNKMKSLVYLENSASPKYNRISFANITFHSNQGTSICAIKYEIYFHGKVLFQNNKAQNGTGIYVSDHSAIIFGENSKVSFFQNSANHRGVAVVLKNHSSITFDQNSVANFTNNKVSSGTIYSEANSSVLFKANCQVIFSGNSASLEGAAIYADNSDITFTENSDVTFSSNYVSITALYNYQYYYGSGGAIFSINYGKIMFEGDSNTAFRNNTAKFGGSIYYGGYLSFEGNSTTEFSSNKADYGGAIYYYRDSILFKGNATAVFSNNTAKRYGGAIEIFSGNISFDENSDATFTGNEAHYDGGAIDSYLGSITFEGNSTTMFTSNNAYYGGAIYSSWSDELSFKGNAIAEFTDNMARYGGAIKSNSIFFNDNSNTLFKGNVALNNGGASFVRENLTFDDNSIVNFAHNKATIGEAISSFRESKVMLLKNATVIFNGNITDWCNDTACSQSAYMDHQGRGSFVVTIDGNGEVQCTNENAFKSFSKKCGHKYLEDMLVNHASNEQVIISDEVIISSVIILTKLSNVSIIGNMNHRIVCINNAGLQVEKCSNVTIEGINFTECGTYDIPVISVLNSSDVTIQNCHFQQTKGQAIVMSESSDVKITHCNFINNTNYRNHGAVIHCSSNNVTYPSRLTFKISNCNFSYNEGASLNYITTHAEDASISLSNSMFYNNHGMSFYLSNYNLYINGQVSFENNIADNGAGLYINDFSNVIVGEMSNVKFTNNLVHDAGAAIFLNNHSSVLFDQNSAVLFTGNKANTGTIYSEAYSNVTFNATCNVIFSNNSAHDGAAIYSSDSSQVAFTRNSKITFSDNNAGVVQFEDNSSTVEFYSSTDFNGGAISAHCNSIITFKDNTMVTFNNNTAYDSGGALFFNEATVIIKGNSTVIFSNNKARLNGGAIYCEHHQTLMFGGNSNVTFSGNEAKNGGAVHVFNTHEVIFTNKTKSTFQNNVANAGGAFYLANSNHTFNEDAKINFYYNTAKQNGGVLWSINSFILFTENSLLFVAHNKAVLNGGVIYCVNSEISFFNFTRMNFSNNGAIDGGVTFANNNSNISFEGHASIIFCKNSARSKGGVGHFSESIITLKEYANLTFKDNNAVSGGALCLNDDTNITFTGNSTALFKSNVAINDGGAINIQQDSNVAVEYNTTTTFTANKAQYGGAMYFDATHTTLTFTTNKSNVRFDINNARFAGNDMYFDSTGSNGNCLNNRIIDMHNISKDFIATPPSKLKFHDPATCINDTKEVECDTYYLRNIMLGEDINIPVCVLNYCNQESYSTQFRLVHKESDQTYFISGSEQILLSCGTFQGVSIIGNSSVLTKTNYTIDVVLHDDRNPDWKQVSVNLIVELTSCHCGFWQKPGSKKCECYDAKDIVTCSGSNSTIKRGYWFGNVTGQPTVALCPINYCNFTCCETSNGYYHLSPVRGLDNQCRSHRSGTACGSCEEGYTLSFDSPECVSVDSCTAGHTVLVILLMMIYWIMIILLVFALMHYKVGIGYLYSITYYYSIIDILLNQNLQASRGLYITVNLISSFSKITPQFLGELCFGTGMTGIDQQFIHYMHPLAVVLILVVIILLARKYQRIAEKISRGIIHVICLLLLLSYTSIASTSLMLMRTLKFHDVDKVYTYLSPDIEYFHDQHLAYGLVALLCTVTIVPGLPLFLIIEPFLSRRFNFTKIKPLLDQFRGCYKDKYRCFAGYYMICRLVIIIIVIADSSNDYVADYLLIIACGIIDLIHVTVKPYNKEILNKLDGITLHLIILVAALRLLDDFGSPFVITLAIVLFILPLLNFMTLALFLNKDGLKKLVKNAKQFKFKHISTKSNTESDAKNKNETPMKEFEIIVDDDMRNTVTSYDIT